MYDFILQIIVFITFGLLVFLMARALPRVPETEANALDKVNYFDRLIKKLPLKEIDARLNLFFGKALRRLKIVVLKVDNLLNRYLKKVKKPESNGENNPPMQ